MDFSPYLEEIAGRTAKGALISYLERERYLLGSWSDSSQSLKVEREYGLHEAEG